VADDEAWVTIRPNRSLFVVQTAPVEAEMLKKAPRIAAEKSSR
jgi:hypothetical protein